MKTNKTEISLVSSFLYDGCGACGVSRQGCYDLPKKVFEIALEEYLTTGINHLSEYDDLVKLNWHFSYSRCSEYSEYTEEQIDLFYRAIERKTFWNIFNIYSEEKIEEIKNNCIDSQREIDNRKSYKYRRKIGFNSTLKEQCKKRDKYKCTKCSSPENLIVHHLIEVSKGGENLLENLTTLCRDCHKKVHSKKGGKR